MLNGGASGLLNLVAIAGPNGQILLQQLPAVRPAKSSLVPPSCQSCQRRPISVRCFTKHSLCFTLASTLCDVGIISICAADCGLCVQSQQSQAAQDYVTMLASAQHHQQQSQLLHGAPVVDASAAGGGGDAANGLANVG